jgi:hypothetical protein
MPLSAEGRQARARIAADRRWHPDRQSTEDRRIIEREALDRQIQAMTTLTPEQRNRLREVMR